MTKRKRNEYSDDDGRTVANMNVEGMKGYVSPAEQKRKDEFRELGVTKEERRAIIKGAYIGLIPAFLLVMFFFGVIALIAYLWLW